MLHLAAEVDPGPNQGDESTRLENRVLPAKDG